MAKKILVVDDDPVELRLLESRLTANGYEVILAHDGYEGLEVLKKESADLIVLDVEMPEMNGYTFLLEMKKIEAYKNIPVIVLTAHEENRPIFARRGILNYMVKPVNFEKLLTLITSLIAK
jgi:DNA-binding response OmpR family regulator